MTVTGVAVTVGGLVVGVPDGSAEPLEACWWRWRAAVIAAVAVEGLLRGGGGAAAVSRWRLGAL